MFPARPATAHDLEAIYQLYKLVAAQPIGIARAPEEVTKDYIEGFMSQANAAGIEMVIENPDDNQEIIAEIHCTCPAPKIFSHVLNELTIAVHPGFQGRGLGKKIFLALLEFITSSRPDILRVELFVQESNERAIALYKKIGFVTEGRFEKRIMGKHQQLEADIPMAWISPAHVLST
jgi:ribosomal protein S18 acetylase RimI-like enzyme